MDFIHVNGTTVYNKNTKCGKHFMNFCDMKIFFTWERIKPRKHLGFSKIGAVGGRGGGRVEFIVLLTSTINRFGEFFKPRISGNLFFLRLDTRCLSYIASVIRKRKFTKQIGTTLSYVILHMM